MADRLDALMQADAALQRLDALEPALAMPTAPSVHHAVSAAPRQDDGTGPQRAAPSSRPRQSLAQQPDELLDGPLAHQPEAALRLARAKIKVLDSELASQREAWDDACRALAAKDKEFEALTHERTAAVKAEKAASAAAEKNRKAAEEAREALESERAERLAVAKLSEQAARAGRAAELEARGQEVRLNRALEEVDRLKKTLDDAKSGARGGSDLARKEAERLAVENKKLERQKLELVAAFKKQMKLIAVLKKQKAHLEGAICLSFTEDEFLRALDST